MGSNYCTVFITIFFIFGVVNSDRGSIQCRDENGDAVDWFVLYKLPKIRESSDPVIRTGLKYLYITDKTVSDGWRLSKQEISSDRSIPGRTLASLYNTSVASEAMWIMYSDSPPTGSNSRYGHAKGIVMTDKNNGFWLIHSVPKYPPIPTSGTGRNPRSRGKSDSSNGRRNDESDYGYHSYYGEFSYYSGVIDDSYDYEYREEKPNDPPVGGKYSYPESGQLYGQSFLCISLNANEMNDIGVQLIFNQVISFRYNLPKVLSTQFPGLVNASRGMRINNPPYNHQKILQSMNGRQFVSFAKGDKWQRDLYDDFIAPKLQTDLLAQTWLNGPGRLPSDCNGTKVFNVLSIVLDVANVDFKSSRDHSKWVVATRNKKENNWVCIGDINRADTQFSRGGGAVCINSMELWNNYFKAVNGIEPCPIKPNFLQRIGIWLRKYIC